MKYKAEEEEMKRLARDAKKDHNAELKEEAKAKKKASSFPSPSALKAPPWLEGRA